MFLVPSDSTSAQLLILMMNWPYLLFSGWINAQNKTTCAIPSTHFNQNHFDKDFCLLIRQKLNRCQTWHVNCTELSRELTYQGLMWNGLCVVPLSSIWFPLFWFWWYRILNFVARLTLNSSFGSCSSFSGNTSKLSSGLRCAFFRFSAWEGVLEGFSCAAGGWTACCVAAWEEWMVVEPLAW